MAVNQFKAFGTGGGANTLTPVAYAALTSLLANGYQSGVADSTQMNTTWRQSAFMAAVWGEIVKTAGDDALDDNDIPAMVTKILNAITELVAYRAAPGTICEYAGATGTPEGRWLFCNGAVVSQTTYAALYAKIGGTHNTGSEGAGNFRLPDYRGVFRRGLDTSRGIDPGRVMNATVQDDQNKAHSHQFPAYEPDDALGSYVAADPGGDAFNTITTDSDGGSEARPVNLATRVFIAY